MEKSFEKLILQLPSFVVDLAEAVPKEQRKFITEVRFFSGQRALWGIGNKNFHFDEHILSEKEIEMIFYSVCKGSVQSFQREICEGFVTMDGGYRVGICGTAVYQGDRQVGLKEITSLNIRLAKSVTGCARELYKLLKNLKLENGNFLLAGPPRSGKTTILRDYARILSGGDGETQKIVALLDERGELLGDFSSSVHILRSIPKEKAIFQALRTLAPQIIICDEISSAKEAELLCSGLNVGSNFIGSIHGENIESLEKKLQFMPFKQQKALDAVVFLKEIGEIDDIYLLKGEKK